MNKIKKIIVMVSFFFVACNSVDAVTLRDLYNDLSNLERSYNEAQKKANITKAELNNVKASIASTEAEIKKAQSDIRQAEKDIETSEKDIEKKKEETNQMLLYLQVMNSSGNSLLDYVFEAENYTDFIYRYSVVTQMSEYNQGIMDELNALIATLNTKKADLAKEQEKLAVKKNDLQAKYLIVQNQYKDEHDDSLAVSGQIAEKKKEIKRKKDQGCGMDQDITTCSGVAAVDGWTYPLTRFRQSSNYGWDEDRWHFAVDLGAGEGSIVRAVANGEVISSRVYWSKYKPGTSCGGYVVQIRHNYKGSYYVSLYMHLLSANVSVGDKVSGGQIIGTSGGGPKEIAKWNDTCTKGAHLHFAMANGRDTIGASNSRGSTVDPVNFFPAMKGINSYYNGG